jgi:hypothetical protein
MEKSNLQNERFCIMKVSDDASDNNNIKGIVFQSIIVHSIFHV